MTKRDADEMLNCMTLQIDPHGDLYMDFKEGKIRVSRKVLTLASSVFRAMLGGSHFRHTSEPTLTVDGTQIISFHEDDYESMIIILNILHFKHSLVPLEVEWDRLYHLAQICDKYDLFESLAHWPNKWSKKWTDSVEEDGYEDWLFIAIAFRRDSLLPDITKTLILWSGVSSAGELITYNDVEIGVGVPESLMSTQPPTFGESHQLISLDRIATARADIVRGLLQLVLDKLTKLRSIKADPVCQLELPLEGWQEKCDAVNLGCLEYEFGHIHHSQDLENYRGTVMGLRERIVAIQCYGNDLQTRVHTEPTHRICDAGYFLAREADKAIDGVKSFGLQE